MFQIKKAEMGVGTLIVFIAMLLVAAVAAGVLIQTATSLQEKSLSTGQQAKSQISTNARVIEVSASDGRDGNLTDFQEIIKLSPGSDPMKLDQMIFTFNTKDRTSTLKYKGSTGICEKNNIDGYNTWNEETIGEELETFNGLIIDSSGGQIREDAWTDMDVDLDDDGTDDLIRVCRNNCPAIYNGTYFVVNLTTDGLIYVHIMNDNNTEVNLNTSSVGFNFTHLNISDYGYITGARLSGTTAFRIFGDMDPADMQFFENPITLEEDYNDDGLNDLFAVNDTHAILFLSDNTTLSIPFGMNICTQGTPFALNIADDYIDGLTTYASLLISTSVTTNCIIPENAITLTPYNLGQGYFTAIYEQEGTNHIDGNLQRGDILRMCYEAPSQIEGDSIVRLNIIPKTGTPTITQFVTPDVINVDRTYLYP